MSPKLYSYLFAQQADSFSFQKTPVHLSARVFSYAKRTLHMEASFHRVEKASSRLPWRGKRSAVAGVNDSPVDYQSRDRAARRRLSAKLTEGWKVGC